MFSIYYNYAPGDEIWAVLPDNSVKSGIVVEIEMDLTAVQDLIYYWVRFDVLKGSQKINQVRCYATMAEAFNVAAAAFPPVTATPTPTITVTPTISVTVTPTPTILITPSNTPTPS